MSLLAAGAYLRFHALGETPAGLNQDEAQIGYEAWSLLHFGTDRNGHSWPVHFVAWGSGLNAPYAYLLMPFVRLGGLTELSIRLPMACLSVVSLFLIWRIAGNAENPKFACIALFFTAFNAWHVIDGRWALESNLTPFVVLAGVYFLSRRDNARWRIQAAFVFFLSLSVYAYGTAYAFAPIFLAFAFLWLALNGKIDRRRALGLSAVAFVTALPIVLLLIVNFLELETIELSGITIPNFPVQPRYESVSFLFGGATFNALTDNLYELAAHLAGGTTTHGLGIFAPFAIVPIVLGTATTLHRAAAGKDYGFHLLMALWFIAALFTAMLLPINSTRGNLLWLPAIWMMALGVFRSCRRRLVLCMVLSLYLAAAAAFVHDYFGRHDSLNHERFHRGLGPAIESALASPDRGAVNVSRRKVQLPETFVLFYGEIPVTRYLETRRLAVRRNEQRTKSFDRFHFTSGCGKEMDVCILHREEIPTIDADEFALERHERFIVARRKQEEERPGGGEAYRVREVGEPAARAHFDLHVRRDEGESGSSKLTYARTPCAPADIKARFFLHVVPMDAGDLPVYSRHGYENLDFQMPADALFDGKCLKTVQLPEYEVDRVRTGQTEKRDGAWTPLWETTIRLRRSADD